MGVRKSKASPSRGGGTAIAVTERSYQICGNLSVTFGDSSPGRGAKGPLRRCKKGAAGGRLTLPRAQFCNLYYTGPFSKKQYSPTILYFLMFHVKHTRHTQKAFPYAEKAARRSRDG